MQRVATDDWFMEVTNSLRWFMKEQRWWPSRKEKGLWMDQPYPIIYDIHDYIYIRIYIYISIDWTYLVKVSGPSVTSNGTNYIWFHRLMEHMFKMTPIVPSESKHILKQILFSLFTWFTTFFHSGPLVKEHPFTLPETNIAPENRPSQKEISIPSIHFQVFPLTVSFREGKASNFGSGLCVGWTIFCRDLPTIWSRATTQGGKPWEAEETGRLEFKSTFFKQYKYIHIYVNIYFWSIIIMYII